MKRAIYYKNVMPKDTKAADLPVQQATKFEFIINLHAAKPIGHTIPVELLARANKVIN